MTLQGLFVETATIQSITPVNVDGRVQETWGYAGEIRCRVTQPTASKLLVAEAKLVPKVDVVIFAPLEAADLLKNLPLPIRFLVSTGRLQGTYEMQKPPRIYENTINASHIEADVVRVEHGK